MLTNTAPFKIWRVYVPYFDFASYGIYHKAMHKFARHAIIALILSFLAYGLVEARFIIQGPEIALSSPSSENTSTSAVILLSGRTERTKELRANGRVIPIDTDGNFVDHISVPQGLSTLTLIAIDARGNTKTITKDLYRD